MTKTAFDWESMPDFVIGRSGYDLYLVQEGYLDRSGLKRRTPDRDWNQVLLHSIPGGCCQFKSFGRLADHHTRT